MKIKKNIIFFYDSGKKIGSGHFNRCLTFSKYILKHSSKYKFFFVSNDKTFFRTILNSGSNFIYLKDKNYQSFYNILKKLNPKYIFIDSYLLNFSTKKKIYDDFKNTIIIEDEIKDNQIGKIYINYNYNFIDKEKNKKLKFKKKFIGYKFFFKNIKYFFYKPKNLNKIKNILIYFGSTKNTNLIKNILEIFSNKKFKELNFKIVLGKYENIDFKKKFNKENYFYFKDLNNEEFLKLTSKCQIAIGSGGVSCWERMYLGLVNFVIITAKNQSFAINQMHKSNFIYKLGTKKNINKKLLSKKLNKVIFDKSLLKKIYGKSSKILLKNEIFKIISHLKL